MNDIFLTPDDTVAENAVHVGRDVDADVLAALKGSDFDIVVDDHESESGLRMSPHLINRIFDWMAMRKLTGRD